MIPATKSIACSLFLTAIVVGSLSLVVSHASSVDLSKRSFNFLKVKALSNAHSSTKYTQSATPADFYLHGTGPSDNPPTLFLDNIAPHASTAKFKDSSSISF